MGATKRSMGATTRSMGATKRSMGATARCISIRHQADAMVISEWYQAHNEYVTPHSSHRSHHVLRCNIHRVLRHEVGRKEAIDTDTKRCERYTVEREEVSE